MADFNNEIIDGQSTVADNLGKTNRNFMLLKNLLKTLTSSSDLSSTLNSMMTNISNTYVKTEHIIDNLVSTATNKPVSARQAKLLKDELNQLNQNIANLTQALNNKADKDGSTLLYKGHTLNFDTALENGWYSFGLTENFGYGILIVYNSTQNPHNNSDNWIWQEMRNTNGVYKRRYKVNSSSWVNWEVI